MKLVIFGLTLSSSWGNGHATLWRALCRALIRRGHEVVFFERDVPYYAGNRDLWELHGGDLVLYPDWSSVLPHARRHVHDADVAMVTSYCADALAATELVLAADRLRVFYDLDSPVTLAGLRTGTPVDYIGPGGLRGFDLVLSYTGGAALTELQSRLGAVRVAPLYGSVDPDVHRPVHPAAAYRADLSYLGTYAADRQATLETLLVKPACSLPERRFVVAGALYPPDFPWTANTFFVRHLAPGDHPAFYSSSELTLNVTRRAMAEMGYCPSGRLFEAAACGCPVLTDSWEGLDAFFEPNAEILVAHSADDAVEALRLSPDELAAIARAARERTLAQHSAEQRVRELEAILDAATLSPAEFAALRFGPDTALAGR